MFAATARITSRTFAGPPLLRAAFFTGPSRAAVGPTPGHNSGSNRNNNGSNKNNNNKPGEGPVEIPVFSLGHITSSPRARFWLMAGFCVIGLGISFAPNVTQYGSFYPAWKDFFPLEAVEKVNVQSGSRLFPRRNLEDVELKQATFDAIRTSLETNHVFVGFNIKVNSREDPDNAVNPAWRENILFAIQSVRWGTCLQGRARTCLSRIEWSRTFSNRFMGTDTKYPRLLELKRKWDPNDVFYAATAVGSEF
ncbi:putative FAD binding domain-containing protein [Colletotrichum sublineola]|uniref:Putative FAD binding domain-containing protein n=1 Tax=Colletotrichum sublineola TaxID=1173701 RepID=A0A066X5A2_COLSU|nr:putative FAD binding domain-containing protein [Colletotrichum sublineola]